MPVSQGYQGAGTNTIDATRAQTAQSAIANAANIVSNATGTVREKLEYFKNEICSAVSYNHAAAENDNTPYGDPWQLIYVFDGNTSTNVVCEGYSKAFKYLFDLAGFDDPYDCIIVSGLMDGGTGAGGHMWNLVRMEDGKNYLVDVTNCDEGTVGYPLQLFLASCASGSVTEGYVFSTGSRDITYTYYEKTRNTFTDGQLTVASTLAVIASGNCGTYLTWTLSNDGVLTISGTGRMRDYYNSTGLPWSEHISEIATVIIEDGVANIGQYAFYGSANLTYISIPDSVTSIGGYAFSGCSSLESLIISDCVTTINAYAFHNCSRLGSLLIGNGVTKIEAVVFAGCTSLTSVTIPDSVTSIGSHAFDGCTGLISLEIGRNVTTIDDFAFYECANLASITLPSSVTSIGEWAFYGCSDLESVTIPVSLTSIGEYAFSNCINLTEVNYEGTEAQWQTLLASIGDGNERLTSLTPTYVAAAPEVVASGICGKQGDDLTWTLDENGLLTISGTGDMADYTSVPVPWHTYRDSITSLNLGEGITSIGRLAFGGCSQLTNVTIPESVTAINAAAFADCSGLTSVTIQGSVTTIGGEAFAGCRNLTAFTIPDTVTRIGFSAFMGCSGLTSITIPASVEELDIEVFQNCTGLTSVTILGPITTLDDSVFEGCSNLTDITLPATVTTIGESAFNGCSNLTDIALPESLTSIGDNAFNGCSGLADITLPASLMTLGFTPFANCSSMTYIDVESGNTVYTSLDGVLLSKDGTQLICCPAGKTGRYAVPDGVTTVATCSFVGCSSLTELALPESANTIQAYAFYFCKGLTSVTIPASITSIGSNAFEDCTALANVYYGGTAAQRNGIDIGNSNTQLTAATWHYDRITVSFNANAADTVGTMDEQTISADTPTSLTACTFTRDGYDFAGWNTEPDGSGVTYADEAVVSFDEDTTLYVQWTAVLPYEVTVNGSVGGTITPSDDSAMAGTTVTLTITPDNGFRLYSILVTDKGGQELQLSEDYSFVMPASDVTITSRFVPRINLEDYEGRYPSLYYYETGWEVLDSSCGLNAPITLDELRQVLNFNTMVVLEARPAEDDPIMAYLFKLQGDDLYKIVGINLNFSGEYSLTLPFGASFTISILNSGSIITLSRQEGDTEPIKVNIDDGTVTINGNTDLQLIGTAGKSTGSVVTVCGDVNSLIWYGSGIHEQEGRSYMGSLYVSGSVRNAFESGCISIDLTNENIGIVNMNLPENIIRKEAASSGEPEAVILHGEIVAPCEHITIDKKTDVKLQYTLYVTEEQNEDWRVAVIATAHSGEDVVEFGSTEFLPDFHANMVVNSDEIDALPEFILDGYALPESQELVLRGNFSTVRLYGQADIHLTGCSIDWIDIESRFARSWENLAYTSITLDDCQVESLTFMGPMDHITIDLEGDTSVASGHWQTYALQNYYVRDIRYFRGTNGPLNLMTNGYLNVLSYDSADSELGAILPGSYTMTEAAGISGDSQAAFMYVSTGDTDLSEEEASALSGVLLDAEPVAWFDIDVYALTFDDNGSVIDAEPVTELENEVPVTLQVPDEGDSYQVVRLHETNGSVVATVLPTNETNDTVTVLSDLFSRYLLVRKSNRITFVNEDGTELQSGLVAYNTLPAYNGEIPAKSADEEYIYTFAGWTPEPTPVTGDATYTATYTETPRSYGAPVWTWTGNDISGYTAAEAAFTTNDGETEFTKKFTDAEIEAEHNAPTCTKSGSDIYTATVTFNGTEYSVSETVTILATGHSWGEVTYTWSSDNRTVTATRACGNDASHVETETVNTTNSTTPATYTEEGEMVYKASFSNAAFAAQTKRVVIPVLQDSLSITTQPMNVTAAVGGAATFKVVASGAEAYQWQVSTNGGATWVNSGANGNRTATLSFTAAAAHNNYQFRCVMTGSGKTVTSESAELTVN